MGNRVGLGIICAVIAAAFYGLGPPLVRTALTNGIPPIESTLFRTVAVSIGFALIGIVRGDRFTIPKAAVPSFIGQAVATLLVSVAYLGSVQFIPVGLAVIIFYFAPVLVMFLAPVAEGKHPGALRIMIASIAFCGLGIAVGPNFDVLDIRGIAMAGAAALGMALQFFSGRALSQYMPPSAFGSLVHVAILLPVLAIALYAGGGNIHFLRHGTATAIGIYAMMGVAGVYLFAYFGQMLALRFAPASTVAPFFNVEPVVTITVAATLLGERMAVNQYVGGAVVLAALIASSLVSRKPTA